MWLLALRKLYEAEQLEHTAVIDTFLQNTVGVADHDNILKVLKSFGRPDFFLKLLNFKSFKKFPGHPTLFKTFKIFLKLLKFI